MSTIFARPRGLTIRPFVIELQDDPEMFSYGHLIKGPDRSHRPEDLEFYQFIDGIFIPLEIHD